MHRYRKRSKLLDSLIDLYIRIFAFISLLVWGKSKSIGIALWFFAFWVGIPFALKLIYKAWKKAKLRQSGIDIIDEMDGEKFEEYLIELFKTLGYKGSLTPRTADYGADLVLEKDSRRVVVQAKRWRDLVGIGAVQEVIGAIKHYNAHKGMVVTNSHFTENAYELAKSNGIELWDREMLIKQMQNCGGREVVEFAESKAFNNQEEQEFSSSNEPVCPLCGNNLVLRNGKRGKFLGCSGYPNCHFTKDINI